MLPVELLVVPFHASVRVNDDPLRPIADAEVEIVVVDVPWLNSATATSPLASFLARMRRVPSLETWLPCRARESWLMASRRGLVRMVLVAADIERMSLPAISGEAMIAHIAKCERCSVS